jgi:FMN-dependent NADH-azoreductase
LRDKSVSRLVSAAIVERLKQAFPDLDVVYRDLVVQPLPHLTLSYLPDNYPLAAGASAPEEIASDLALSHSVLEEFQSSDIVVIGAPMYNFTVPTQLKAWIDRIVIAGKTFRYSAEGAVERLAADKRVIIALSRGGFYGPESGMSASEHLETYLRAIFGFIGIDPQIIVAEGIQMGPDSRAKAIDAALMSAGSLAIFAPSSAHSA